MADENHVGLLLLLFLLQLIVFAKLKIMSTEQFKTGNLTNDLL